ncbi:MAG: protein kinase domain-containing protein, partial [Phycisphaerales bacterium]
VMHHVPGDNLTKVIEKAHGGESIPDAAARISTSIGYVIDLLEQLSRYHAAGLWHKDVKPDNIIIDERNGRARLVDFGLVTNLRSAMTLTTHGTEYFRDPEMVRMSLKGVKVHEISGVKFDVYGAGAVLYATLENSFPAHGVLSRYAKESPEALRWIARRAMADYRKRYPSAEAMLADLRMVSKSADPFTVRISDLPGASEDQHIERSDLNQDVDAPTK